MKEGARTNMQHTFFLPLPLYFFLFLSLFLFLPLPLNPTTKSLLLVSDFYLVAPGPRFISRFSPSYSLDSFFLLSSSSSTLSLSPTNSPQPRTVRNFLFRISDPQARFSPPSFPFSSSSSSCFSFFGRCQSFQSFQSYQLIPLIRDSLISRTTSVKIDNRASMRVATLCTVTETQTTFFFV